MTYYLTQEGRDLLKEGDTTVVNPKTGERLPKRLARTLETERDKPSRDPKISGGPKSRRRRITREQG
jgi:hypothetical protein